MNPITEIKQVIDKVKELHEDVEFLKDIVHAVFKVVAEHEAKKGARNAASNTT